MSSASPLTQEEYKTARAVVANTLVNGSPRSSLHHLDQAEADDLAAAERLLDAGIIDIAVLDLGK